MDTKKSTAKYWIWFFIWFGLMVFMLATPSVRQFFWVTMPGTCTYFALAMDIM